MNMLSKYPIAAAAISGIVGMFVLSGQAHAQFEVRQPQVHKGDAEIELYGAYYSGLPSLPNSAIRQDHELEIYYGVTDWWAMKVEAEFEQKRASDGSFDSLKLKEIEIQSILELLPLEGDGIGAGIFVSYGENLLNGKDESELEFGPILKAVRGPLSATVNLFPKYEFDIQEVENKSGVISIEEEPDHWNLNYAVQVKHKTGERVAFGLESYGTFKDIGADLPGNQPEIHRAGPVVYLKLGEGEHGHDGHEEAEEGPEFEMTFGLLFGLNDNTSDVAFKYNAEIEF